MDPIKNLAPSLLFIFALFALPVYERSVNRHAHDPSVDPTPEQVAPVPASSERPIRNVILMIGDGMGIQQISQAVYFRKLARKNEAPLAFETLSRSEHAQMTYVSTYSANSITTDSAAGSTAMACGIKTSNRRVGAKPNGRPCDSILDLARRKGRATGIVATTRLTHATPAAFYASAKDRDDEKIIAPQLLQGDRIDLALGGGSRFFLPDGLYHSDIEECKNPPRAKADWNQHERELLEWIDKSARQNEDTDLIELARTRGFRIACYKNQLPAPEEIQLGRDKVLGLFAGSHLPQFQEREHLADFLPSLAEMTGYALKVLERDPDGLFLVVESGLIDHTGHYNDAATQLLETLDFSAAIQVALAFTERRPDTLLIVTADHETGGFSLSYHRDRHNIYRLTDARIFEEYLKQGASFQRLLNDALAKDPSGATTPASRLLKAFDKYDVPWDLSETDAESVFAVSFDDAVQPDNSPTDYPGAHSPWIKMYYGNRLGRILGRQTHAVWSSGNHSHTPVPAFIRMPGIENAKLPGWIDNTDIHTIMKQTFD